MKFFILIFKSQGQIILNKKVYNLNPNKKMDICHTHIKYDELKMVKQPSFHMHSKKKVPILNL